MNYPHIFFDLDHTLWDFDTNAEEALSELYTEFGLEAKAIGPVEFFLETYLKHNAILWTRYEKGYITSQELRWRRMWRTLLDFKIADEKLSKEMGAWFLETLPTKSNVFEYTFEILDYLKGKGYQMHLITNGFEKTQRSKLANSKLDTYFTHVVTSEISNSVKPKREIFEYAIKQAGCKMEEGIMIGDNLNADIMGATKAGMDTVFANHIKADCSIKPTYIIHHFKELEAIL